MAFQGFKGDKLNNLTIRITNYPGYKTVDVICGKKQTAMVSYDFHVKTRRWTKHVGPGKNVPRTVSEIRKFIQTCMVKASDSVYYHYVLVKGSGKDRVEKRIKDVSV